MKYVAREVSAKNRPNLSETYKLTQRLKTIWRIVPAQPVSGTVTTKTQNLGGMQRR